MAGSQTIVAELVHVWFVFAGQIFNPDAEKNLGHTFLPQQNVKYPPAWTTSAKKTQETRLADACKVKQSSFLILKLKIKLVCFQVI